LGWLWLEGQQNGPLDHSVFVIGVGGVWFDLCLLCVVVQRNGPLDHLRVCHWGGLGLVWFGLALGYSAAKWSTGPCCVFVIGVGGVWFGLGWLWVGFGL